MFKKLIGNDHIKDVLRRFVSHRRVPNSLIFAGDDGVGKRQFALELAKALICLEPMDGEACDVCSACRRADHFTFPKSDDKDAHKRIQWSNHPDIGSVIPFNRNILVDAVRHLETEANYQPYEAHSRFFMIDDADKMNDAASNALLKTLEEPPATSHIFLIASRPDSLLATIRSRCQLLRFAPVETGEIEKYLISERAFSHDEARIAASLAHGSVGRAVSINVAQMYSRREKMLGVISEAIGGGDRALLLRSAEEINDAKNRDHFEEYMDILQSLVYDVWSISISGDPARVVNSDLSPVLNELAKKATLSDLPSWLTDIDTIRQNLIVNINRKIAADALFVGMTA